MLVYSVIQTVPALIMPFGILLGLVLVILHGFSAETKAQGFASLSVNPQRLVLDERARSGALSLTNNGNKVATYRIRFVDFVSDDDGKIEQVETAPEGHPSAKHFLRYSPRQVVLEPGQGQTVRILARKPQNLPDGEYRAHLLVQMIPDKEKSSSDIEAVASGGSSILRGSITPTYGMALPVIVKHGTTEAKGGIGSVELDHVNGKKELTVELLRAGNASVYGDLEATWIMPNGQVEDIGLVRGIAVYNPYPRRRFTMTLNRLEGMSLKGGRLDIVYRDALTGEPIAQAQHTLSR